jgi:branched-chain amino acid transport system ATP-binding protein
MSGPVLEARGVTVSYGGVVANDRVDLTVEQNGFVGLIGANGAGKTTFIDAITGYAEIAAGSIHFDGVEITGASPDKRARGGLVRTFQSLELFDDLTVRDNLLVACERPRWWAPRDLLGRRGDRQIDEQVDWALARLEIEEIAERLPEELSHGQRKLVGLARALASKPKLILVDEPAAGLDVNESEALREILATLPADGIAVFLIDHDMGLVLSVCERIYALDFGRVIASGTPAEIRSDSAVIGAYLGEGGDSGAGLDARAGV